MNFLCVSNCISNYVLRFGKNSLSFKHIITSSNVRYISSHPLKKNKSQYVQEGREIAWTPIYHFPFIQMARLINRLKLYQSFFTIVAMPLSIGLYSYDLIDLTSVSVVTGSSMFTCLTLYVVTSFFKRLIGVIFLSEDEKFVKIAHLTFWGHRKDIVVPVKDITPLTEGTCSANDAFVKLHRNSTDEVLYLTLRFGRFLDRGSFQNIFGSFEILGFKE